MGNSPLPSGEPWEGPEAESQRVSSKAKSRNAGSTHRVSVLWGKEIGSSLLMVLKKMVKSVKVTKVNQVLYSSEERKSSWNQPTSVFKRKSSKNYSIENPPPQHEWLTPSAWNFKYGLPSYDWTSQDKENIIMRMRDLFNYLEVPTLRSSFTLGHDRWALHWVASESSH